MSLRTNDPCLDGNDAAGDPCAGCSAIPRRDFLRDAGLFAAGILVALGATPSRAFATPIEFISATRGGREDKTYPIPAKDGVQIDKDAEVDADALAGKSLRVRACVPAPEHGAPLVRQGSAVRVSQASLTLRHARHLHQGQWPCDARARPVSPFARTANNVVVNLDKALSTRRRRSRVEDGVRVSHLSARS